MVFMKVMDRGVSGPGIVSFVFQPVVFSHGVEYLLGEKNAPLNQMYEEATVVCYVPKKESILHKRVFDVKTGDYLMCDSPLSSDVMKRGGMAEL